MTGMDTKEFQSQLTQMWATRPVRPENRTVAGVCSGIAARYRVDPTLVKVAFVVSALFGGSGLVLYLAAWVAFPSANRARNQALREPASTGRQDGGRGRGLHNPQVLLLIVLAIVVITSIGPNRTWGSGGIVGAILMLGGWFLLYQRTPRPPAGTSIDTVTVLADVVVPPPTAGQFERWVPRAMSGTAAVSPASTGAGSPTVDMRKAPTASDTGTPNTGSSPETPSDTATSKENGVTDNPTSRIDLHKSTADAPGTSTTGISTADRWTPPATPTPAYDEIDAKPPSWDPLGAAPFAWDLPEPSSPEPPPVPTRRRRSPLTLVVLGLAVIVGAIGAALNQSGVDWFTVPRILSMCLAVVGVGLVVASLMRRRTGEHSTGLVPVAILLGIATIVTTAASGIAVPEGGVGDRTWKPLTENDIQSEYRLGVGEMTLDLREVDLTSDRRVELRNGMGVIEVLVGDDMNVRASCNTGIGNITCPSGLDGGRDGTDGPVLEIDAHTGMGEVKVLR
ncbi:PspC domain-containing protein [Gordonia paraffinivorans]|uniref:PspC domain-containing protein n=1 Tax=Gordonia paraffinivorans TaxID=175628 RepID=UPI0024322FC9|nr:PspC domain-containing protein [Gordonia paraffinivorans]